MIRSGDSRRLFRRYVASLRSAKWLQAQIRASLATRVRPRGRRVLLYGADALCELVLRVCRQIDLEIVGIVDGNRKKQGRDLWGHEVLAPQRGLNLDFDGVVICSLTHQEEIARTVRELAPPSSFIEHLLEVDPRVCFRSAYDFMRTAYCVVADNLDDLKAHHPDYLARYALAVEQLTGEETVLDCACGCGAGTWMLSERARVVYGCDGEKRLLRFARCHWNGPNIRYRVIDPGSDHFELDDSFFDLIVTFETLGHVSDAAHFLRELHRLLQPTGRLFVSSSSDVARRSVVREYTAEELRCVVGDAGFEIGQHLFQDRATGHISPEPLCAQAVSTILICTKG